MDEHSDDETRARRLTVRKRAMDLLARREHARAELIVKLCRRGYGKGDIETVLDELESEGLLSDVRFARAAVASKAQRGIGPVRIRAELRQAGVADAIVVAALDDTENDWDERAGVARRKRYGEGLPEDYPEKARQMRFLQRRGFEMDQIIAALKADPDS